MKKLRQIFLNFLNVVLYWPILCIAYIWTKTVKSVHNKATKLDFSYSFAKMTV